MGRYCNKEVEILERGAGLESIEILADGYQISAIRYQEP